MSRHTRAARVREIRELAAYPPPPADYAWAAYLHALERARSGEGYSVPHPRRDQAAERVSVRLWAILALLTPVVLFVVLVLP